MMGLHGFNDAFACGDDRSALRHIEVDRVQRRLGDVSGDPAAWHLGEHVGQAVGPGHAIQGFSVRRYRPHERDDEAGEPHAAQAYSAATSPATASVTHSSMPSRTNATTKKPSTRSEERRVG